MLPVLSGSLIGSLLSIVPQCVPLCSQCSEGDGEGEKEGGVMKPDIVFFGESLPATFHQALEEDKSKVNLYYSLMGLLIHMDWQISFY